jgi:hypothetical protein
MEELRVVTPRAHRDEPGVGRKRFEYPHGALPYGRRPPARGEAGVSLLAETPVVPAPYCGETPTDEDPDFQVMYVLEK